MKQKEEQARVYKVGQALASCSQTCAQVAKQIKAEGTQLLRHSNYQIKDGNETAFFASSVEVKQVEDELLLKETRWKRLKKEAQLYERMSHNPYFGKIEVQLEGEKEPLAIYLGLASFMDEGEEYVYDWRAPIASLFYRNHLGAASYRLENGEEQLATVQLKRQFLIENQEIKVMVDTSETIMDTMLLRVLNEKGRTHMKEVVTTIQEDQNEMIRSPKANILIEGIAGSGKTAVLMQRVAYLLYEKRKQIQAQQMLMFSPNPIFSEYISQVLPSLGEEDIPRFEFSKWIRRLVPYNVLVTTKEVAFQQKFFLQELKSYAQTLKEKGLQFNALYLAALEEDGERTLVFSPHYWRTLKKKANPNLSLHQQLEWMQQEALKKLQNIQAKYEKSEAFETLFELYGSKFLQAVPKETVESALESTAKTLLSKYLFAPVERAVKNFDFVHTTKQVLHYIQTVAGKEAMQEAKAAFLKGTITYPLALLFLLFQQWLKAKPLKQYYAEVFVDEVQDYSALELCVLALLFPNAHFSLCGDYHQIIQEQEQIFQYIATIFQKDFQRYQLTTSYRNTYEITQFCGAIFGEQHEVKVVRHGPKPKWIQGGLTSLLAQAKKEQKRVAFIAPSEQAAQTFFAQYKEQYALKYIRKEQSLPETGCFLLDVELAKGLEFDTVILVETEAEENANCLYTMASRAMHDLYIYSVGQLPAWLQALQQKDPNLFLCIAEN